MCGRARLSSDVSEIKLVFSIPPHRPVPNFPPSWNVAPTDQLPVVRYDRKAGERSLDLLRWGLVPYWAKDLNVGFANINAKAEGVENRPAFRAAFQRRRCIVPVDSFYEWKKIGTSKQPYAIALADRSLMALAGLWENWRSPAGEWVRSFAIVTTTPNELCAELHNRMPVVLKPETWSVCLGKTLRMTLLAEIHEAGVDLALYLAVGIFRDTDAARSSNAFKPGGDVDAVTQDVVALNQDVSEVDADAQSHTAIVRYVDILLSRQPL